MTRLLIVVAPLVLFDALGDMRLPIMLPFITDISLKPSIEELVIDMEHAIPVEDMFSPPPCCMCCEGGDDDMGSVGSDTKKTPP